ncbi:hypothetical protein FCM35_KLT19343 [Carex littledalei]|uniref:Uncharacterized protein n=1 Tax=Carex littledalei TaxID=544730 RepID=A0A833RDT6_9POAL|nr:hypothetical protein FCM35_KLT19343 [Carex littledalei]
MPWEEWWEYELTQDDSDPHIALLPLNPDMPKKFNETAAWEYAKRMSGYPYGYHNMIFSWIDTISDNYPSPLDAHVMMFFLKEHIILKNSTSICVFDTSSWFYIF